MTNRKVTIYFAHGIKFDFHNVTIEQMAALHGWYEGIGQRVYEYTDDFGNKYHLNREYVCAIQYKDM